MIENSESEESGSENELNDQDKIKLDPVKAENLKNGFTFGTAVGFLILLSLALSVKAMRFYIF